VIFKTAAAAILDFQKIEMYVIVPNFINIGQTVAEIWRFNGLFFKMADVCRFGFVERVLGPPAMTTWWSLSLCKISLKLME